MQQAIDSVTGCGVDIDFDPSTALEEVEIVGSSQVGDAWVQERWVATVDLRNKDPVASQVYSVNDGHGWVEKKRVDGLRVDALAIWDDVEN